MILVVYQREYQPNVAGPILESKGMRGIFQKKGKIFENLGKRQPHAFNYPMDEAARICPV